MSGVVRALVTGGRGFVGVHLAAHLRASGDEVVVVDRNGGGPDLLDRAGWDATLAEHRPDVVYHLAAQASVPTSWADPVGTFRTNAEGTLHVLGACEAARVARVLVVSSADVYGAADAAELPLRESSPLRPVTPYAASKAAAEQVARQAWFGHGLEVVIARPFNHLGPGQDDRFVAGALAHRIARNEVEGIDEVPVGNLSARRDFTDVRDVVAAYRLLVERGSPGETYVVASGRAVAVSELAAVLLTAARRPMRLVEDPSLFRPVDVPLVVGDAGKLTAATGWVPTIPLETTLRDLLASARDVPIRR